MRAQPGERVLFRGHASWRSMIGFYVWGIVLAVVAGVIAGGATATAAGRIKSGWVALAVVAVCAVVFAGGALRRMRTTYTVTTQRLTIERGVLARDLHETRLERLQNVNSRQTLFERMLGVGDVHFDTAGGADCDFSFRGVSDPRQIVRAVDGALHQLPGAGWGP